MASKHPRTLGPKIAADYRLLNFLKGQSRRTVSELTPGTPTISVDGGVLATECTDDHDEVLGCWVFYRTAGKAN
ncbi:MAG: hypothetical protein L0221_13200 [Chloroflexi bacterium]|nr:hypothetical protein [Chloroflexota bacterium]